MSNFTTVGNDSSRACGGICESCGRAFRCRQENERRRETDRMRRLRKKAKEQAVKEFMTVFEEDRSSISQYLSPRLLESYQKCIDT